MSDFIATTESKTMVSDRQTGLSLAFAFTMPIFWIWLKTGKLWLWTLPLAGIILLFAILRPKVLSPLNRVFRQLSQNIHGLLSSTALIFIFFAVVTPMGIALRFTRRNPMPLLMDRSLNSYWINSETPKSWRDYFREQF